MAPARGRTAYDPLIRVHSNNHGIRGADPRDHSGGIGVQPARGFAKGRQRPDAADARHRWQVWGPRPFSGRKHSRRCQLPETAAGSVRNNEQLALAAYNAGPEPWTEMREQDPALPGDAGLRAAHHRSQRHGARGAWIEDLQERDIVDGHSVVRSRNTRPRAAITRKSADSPSGNASALDPLC